MKKYDQYKSSGLPLIGDIPEHWEVKKLKHIKSEEQNAFVDGPFGSNLKSIHFIEDGEVYVVESGFITTGTFVTRKFKTITKEHFETIKRSSCKEGDIIIAKIGANYGMSGILPLLDKDSVVSGNSLKLTVNTDLYFNRFIHFSLLNLKNNGAFDVIVNSTAQPALSLLALNDLKIPVPNKMEQVAAIDYLTHKLKLIDDSISMKRTLIGLIHEEKAAIINHTVTKGIDADTPMKPSGVEWLGDIPAHWEVKKLKYVIKDLESGVSVNSIDTPVDGNEHGVLKTSCVYDYTFRPTENKKILEEDLNRASCPVKKNSIIISRMNTPELVGASGYVDSEKPNLFLPDRLWQAIVFNENEVNVEWLSNVIKCSRFKEVLSYLATGTSSSMKNISKDDLLNITIPFPCFQEQQNILWKIKCESEKISTTIIKIEREIELLQEFKTSLIYEVVTGKVKVDVPIEEPLEAAL